LEAPVDEIAAAAGRGHLRASHADREQVIDSLKAAFVQGRLAKDKFDLRVGQALASRTYEDLAGLTADLPAGPAAARSPREPAAAPAQPVSKTLMWGAFAISAAAIGAIAASFPANSFLLLVAGVLAILMAAPVAGTLMLESWRQKRPDRGLPPGPARRGRALEDDPDGDMDDGQILFESREGVRACPGPGRIGRGRPPAAHRNRRRLAIVPAAG
jgi:Domain of unknown function (DUF1707)